LTRAYQTLNDDGKRQMYDSYGMDANEQTNFTNTGGQRPGGPNGGFNQSDFNGTTG
jgi:DnaJ-class molecular chaperone